MRESYILVFFLVIGVLSSSFLLYFNTDVFVAHPGSHISRQIAIPNDDVDSKEVLLVRLKRSPETPGALDWARFVNNQQFLYIPVSDNTEFIKVNIDIPSDIVPGRYFIDYEIQSSSTTKRLHKSFKVV